jgi:hypothetical protein
MSPSVGWVDSAGQSSVMDHRVRFEWKVACISVVGICYHASGAVPGRHVDQLLVTTCTLRVSDHSESKASEDFT